MTDSPDPTAGSDDLTSQLYEELRGLAENAFRRQRADHTLSPTALVHEAYLKMEKGAADRWQSKAHFLAVAATAMRQILMNHARERRAVKRGAGQVERVTLDRVLEALATDSIDALMLDEALHRLARLSERQARIVELRVFGGLTIDETAKVLELGATTVKSEWAFARAWLKRELAGTPGG